MSENDKKTSETETILMALDQISQTIDVMTSVVGRLRNYVQQHKIDSLPDENLEGSAKLSSDHVIH